MNLADDGQWHRDDTIRAEKVSVGLARDAETGSDFGVLAMFTVPVIEGEPMQVSVILTPEQTITFANALLSTALDIGGAECIGGTLP